MIYYMFFFQFFDYICWVWRLPNVHFDPFNKRSTTTAIEAKKVGRILKRRARKARTIYYTQTNRAHLRSNSNSNTLCCCFFFVGNSFASLLCLCLLSYLNWWSLFFFLFLVWLFCFVLQCGFLFGF